MQNNFKFVHAGKLQGNMRSFYPYNFTRIFTKIISIHAHADFTIIPNVKIRRRGVEINKSTIYRDILDPG